MNKNYTFSNLNDSNVSEQIDTIREFSTTIDKEFSTTIDREFSTTIDREAVYEDTQVENKI
jgi:hypothetical protein